MSGHEESVNFLDIEIILTNGKDIQTDIYYKDANPLDYLNFPSAHPTRIKNTIPYNLAKRVVAFVTKEDRIRLRLNKLKNLLQKCYYPINVIDQEFHKAELRGPAQNPKHDIIPLVTTYRSSLC